jgi:hypothetical protein
VNPHSRKKFIVNPQEKVPFTLVFVDGFLNDARSGTACGHKERLRSEWSS